MGGKIELVTADSLAAPRKGERAGSLSFFLPSSSGSDPKWWLDNNKRIDRFDGGFGGGDGGGVGIRITSNYH